MTPLCKLATIHGLRGWKLRPLTRLLFVSNLVRNSELLEDIPTPAASTCGRAGVCSAGARIQRAANPRRARPARRRAAQRGAGAGKTTGAPVRQLPLVPPRSPPALPLPVLTPRADGAHATWLR